VPSNEENEKPNGEECGVFGVWAPGEDVAKMTYNGLYAQQHRGQEAAGMAVSDGAAVVVYKELGLVAQVFDEAILGTLRGHLAVGHTRYSTTGSCTWENAQPSFRPLPAGGNLALGHNGNLTNTSELARRVDELGLKRDAMGATNDSDLITALLAASADKSVEQAARDTLPWLQGAFSLVFMDEHTLYCARDPHGVRPLVLGKIENGWVVASETAALDIVGATFIREIEPGELLAIDEHGPRSSYFAEPTPKGCLFEYVYLARPDTSIAGRSVYSTRVETGRTLAFEAPVDADLVIPVPESGTPAAIGYAEQSGIPYGQGLVKNAYVGRTFIQPSQTIRQLGIRLKLNPLREVIKGKRLVVVDDSIVRGNTQRALVRMLREAGATEVHVRISSPPVTDPCFYGIDFASKGELIASSLSVDEICATIGADSLAFVSLDGLTTASAQQADKLCRACFTGDYPIPLPEQDLIGKHVLEGLSRTVTEEPPADPLPVASVLGGQGGADALRHP
jgi:amidophosphoribosyltransferase